mmetsp:Transcript_24409/g.38475  ORF Transcript_24409/g.38475 Transcript_24409/m.38475 type:complete len:562 (-) Transcript_24409:328-2013(-)
MYCNSMHLTCLVGFVQILGVWGSVSSKWVDQNTPVEDRVIFKGDVIENGDGIENVAEYKLVMSDEFEESGREFDSTANDPMWTAISKPDDTNQAAQFYDPGHVSTVDGKLQILTTPDKVKWKQWDWSVAGFNEFSKNYTSGMVMSWNKFCFTGGVLEVSAQLPGDGVSGTFWPAAWLMGNLAKATFGPSTEHMWPWSTDECGDLSRDAQKISACRWTAEEDEWGMNPYQSRGAPEVDLFEVMPGIEGMDEKYNYQSYISTSLQVSPAIPKHHPVNLHPLNSSDTWYSPRHGNRTQPNTMFYSETAGMGYLEWLEKGYVADAVSGNTKITNDHFSSQHIYRLEWEPGADGHLNWYVDGEFLWGVDGADLKAKSGAVIPEEPMYLIFNTAISDSWAMPEPCDMKNCHSCYRCYDCTNPDCYCSMPTGMQGCANFPGRYLIDYVRIYQDPNNPKHTLECDTKDFPSAQYIAKNGKLFTEWQPDHLGPFFGLTFAQFLLAVVLGTAGICFITRTANQRRRNMRRAEYQALRGKKSFAATKNSAVSSSQESMAPTGTVNASNVVKK